MAASDARNSGQTDEQTWVLKVSDVVDVIASTTPAVEAISFAIRVIAGVEVMVTATAGLPFGDGNVSDERFVDAALDRVAEVVDVGEWTRDCRHEQDTAVAVLVDENIMKASK